MGNSSKRISQPNELVMRFQNKSLTLCYANVILQVLFHHPVFVEIVCANGFSNKRLMGRLQELYKEVQSSGGEKSVSTLKLMQWVQKESLLFQRNRHQDCHEFFLWVMDQISDQLKEGDKTSFSRFQDEFYFKHVFKIQCLKCKTVTQCEAPEVDLSLLLPEPNVCLQYIIESNRKEERLEGKNQFECDTCKSKQDAKRHSLIKTLPNFLAINLKRFKYNQTKRGLTKLNWNISFPPQLQLASDYSQEKKDYKLVGVVAHVGAGDIAGHYLAYIRMGKKWYIFNDDEPAQEVEWFMLESLWGYKGLSKCAYMLFYSI